MCNVLVQQSACASAQCSEWKVQGVLCDCTFYTCSVCRCQTSDIVWSQTAVAAVFFFFFAETQCNAITAFSYKVLICEDKSCSSLL